MNIVRKLSVPLIALALSLAPAAVFADTLSSNLAVGSSGSEVTSLQTFLATDSSIYPEGLVTGYFGDLTKAAVIRFQAKYGIDQVGSVGPITRAKINSLIGSGSGSGGGTYSGDVSAPIMSAATVSVTANSATFHWSTNESARSRVMYGTNWPFLYAAAPSVSDATIDASSDVTLSGLQPHTRYYYTRESVDTSGNVMWTVGEWFTTAG